MPDVINAKCFGCNKVIRVPATLGGRNAKCPGCGQIFTIPTPADSTEGIISDEMLPTVAQDEEVLEGEIVGEAPLRTASRRSHPHRTKRDTPSKRLPAVPKRSPLPLILGAVGLIAAIAVLAFVMTRPPKAAEEPKKSAPTAGPEKKRDPQADALEARTREYAAALKAGRILEVMDFFDVSDRAALRAEMTKQLESGLRYDDLVVGDAASTGDSATVRIHCTLVRNEGKDSGKTIVLKWKRAAGVWKLAEIPARP